MQCSKACICKCMLVYAITVHGSKALDQDETFNFTKENNKVFLFLFDLFFVFAGNINPQCFCLGDMQLAILKHIHSLALCMHNFGQIVNSHWKCFCASN